MSDGRGEIPRTGLVVAIAVGGLGAGALDIGYAIAAWAARGVGPIPVLQGVASGLLGRAAFDGGAATAALGAALHFAMALAMAGAFVAAARLLPQLTAWPVAAGAGYGAALYLFMNRVVLPLSNYPHGTPELNLVDLAVHVLLVGLPIAWAARRWAAGPNHRALPPSTVGKEA